MSTTPAQRSLLTRLVDDAAVFPPGSSPVPTAWADHLALRAGGYADLLGPLLIGASAAASLVEAAQDAPPEGGRVGIGVIARPGTEVQDLIDAVQAVRDSDHLDVASVEVAHDEAGTWRRALELGVPVAVEVGREPVQQVAALAEIAGADAEHDQRVLAKLRTQGTADAPVPTSRELAEFLNAVRDHGLGFKLTGGLHHAVALTVEGPDGPEEQHGVLNVVAATHYLEEGATLPDLQAVLEIKDPQPLAALASGLDEQAVSALRGRFVSFGCCGVTDPLDELADLGVLDR